MVIFILKSIYKITNLLNGKIYIGQSINPENRWKQHQCSDSIIGNAIRKYGIENFSFEIIEENIENYNEREIFWINFYNSDNKKFGYNLTSGGENPPILRGENSSISKYTDAFVESIKQDLLNTNMSFQEIVDKYQISNIYLSMLNRGKFRKNSNHSYPLRKHGNENIAIDVVMKIIYELQYTTKTTKEIAKENNIGEVVVWEINTGRKQNLTNDIEYPIRYPYHTISKKLAKTLVKELQDNKYQLAQIAKMYNISYLTISRFNRGKICKNPDLDYPIRPRSKKVCKPVETIPS